MAVNTGVSLSQRRRYTARKPNTPPSTNGSRHHPPSTSAWLNQVLIAVETSEPIRMPAVSPADSVAQAKPTRPRGACSATKVQAPGTSPPIAMPCTMRSASSSNGAATPICA